MYIDICEIKLPIKVEMLVSKIITTPRTDNPLFPIFLSKVSTLDKRSVVKRNAKTNIKITSDTKGQIKLINQIAINVKIIR